MLFGTSNTHTRDFAFGLTAGPDRVGATLGRTASATASLPDNLAFAIERTTASGESNDDDETEHSRGAADLFLPICGLPGSSAALSEPCHQDDRAVSAGRPDRHHGPTGCARIVDQARPGGRG